MKHLARSEHRPLLALDLIDDRPLDDAAEHRPVVHVQYGSVTGQNPNPADLDPVEPRRLRQADVQDRLADHRILSARTTRDVCMGPAGG